MLARQPSAPYVAPPATYTAAISPATIVFWILFTIYAIARVVAIFPSNLHMMAILVLHIFPPGVFAMIHGGMMYRVRGILVFATLCLGVGFIFECLGIRTGFPFGHYYFTDVMGPKLLQVPILIGAAYVGMGYLSWVLARLILGNARSTLSAAEVFTTPLLAGFIMVAWDLSSDPVWATITRCWIWQSGGPYFGVPISNFFGWYLTVIPHRPYPEPLLVSKPCCF